MTHPPLPGPGDREHDAVPPGAPAHPAYPAPPPAVPAPPPMGVQGHPYGTYGTTATSGRAVWSLVLGLVGLLGFFLFSGVFSIAAIILGQVAKKEIDAAGGALTGRGQAEAGFVLGVIGVVVLAIMVVLLLGSGTVISY